MTDHLGLSGVSLCTDDLLHALMTDGDCECARFEVDRGFECCGVSGGCGGPCVTFPCWGLTT